MGETFETSCKDATSSLWLLWLLRGVERASRKRVRMHAVVGTMYETGNARRPKKNFVLGFCEFGELPEDVKARELEEYQNGTGEYVVYGYEMSGDYLIGFMLREVFEETRWDVPQVSGDTDVRFEYGVVENKWTRGDGNVGWLPQVWENGKPMLGDYHSDLYDREEATNRALINVGERMFKFLGDWNLEVAQRVS